MSSFGPWLEAIAAVGAGTAAFLLGRWCSRLPKPYWTFGYLLPLGFILLYCLAMFEPRIALTPPISWMMLGRVRFICFNCIAVMMLSVPLSRLPAQRSRVAVCFLIVVLTAVSTVPFLAPAFNRSYLAGLKTRIDADGVCRQSNDYTCAPAAAVTALRKLGFSAEEGEIAILAHTSSLTGTEPDVLAKELCKKYGADGLSVEYRSFRDLDELKQSGLTIVVTKFSVLQNHCVTILGVETNCVIVGDPLRGLMSVPLQEFERKWLFCGIALKRSAPRHSRR